MGPCASSNPSRPHTTLPLTFKSQPPAQDKTKSHENEFIFKLTNVCVVPIRSVLPLLTKNQVKLTFSMNEISDIHFNKEQMTTAAYTHPELTDEIDRY